MRVNPRWSARFMDGLRLGFVYDVYRPLSQMASRTGELDTGRSGNSEKNLCGGSEKAKRRVKMIRG
jgi:hypothetical protein